MKSKIQTRKPSKLSQVKSGQRMQRDDSRVTTFPQAKGKVVHEVRFTHHEFNNVLVIAFKDRTVLVFDIDPEPLVLPVRVRANYFGDRRSARKTWEGLGE